MGIIERANAKSDYAISAMGAQEFGAILEADDNPNELLKLLRAWTGE